MNAAYIAGSYLPGCLPQLQGCSVLGPREMASIERV
jgi:hypothetical protein